jgi:hypothetical protein
MDSGVERKPGGSSRLQEALRSSKPLPPGKRTRAEQLAPPAITPVQRRIDGVGGQSVQRKPVDPGYSDIAEAALVDASDSSAVQHAAATGVASGGGPLPYGDTIQRLFGRHDIRGIEAHIGGAAETACRSIGAEAYATGNCVAFAARPSLHLAAHEAAHVVQQRAGVQLKGGVGAAGDSYEKQADEVADRVVAGLSAEDLLPPQGASPLPAVPPRTGVQRKAPTHVTSAADLGARADKLHADDLTSKQIHEAIAWNNQHWRDIKQRQALRTFLADEQADEGNFTEANVRAARKIQLGAGVEPEKANGKIDDTTMAILLQLRGRPTFDFEGQKPKAKDVELLFVPGEFEDLAAWKAAVETATHDGPKAPYRAMMLKDTVPSGTGRLYVKWKGNIVDVVNAHGGPPMTVKDIEPHTAGPTAAGTWKLGAGKSVVTSSWPNSQIPWGAEVRKRHDGEWEFKDPDSNKWKIATGDQSQLEIPVGVEVFERNKKGQEDQPTLHYQLNDFGKKGWRILGTDGQFIHTTPEDERTTLKGKTPELSASHGCVHLDPGGRNRLDARGFLQAGVTFTVRKYTAHLLPEAMRQMMQGNNQGP